VIVRGDRHVYLCVWDPFELPDVCIGVVQVTNERPSPRSNGQNIRVVVLRITASINDEGKSCSDQNADKHLERLQIE